MSSRLIQEWTTKFRPVWWPMLENVWRSIIAKHQEDDAIEIMRAGILSDHGLMGMIRETRSDDVEWQLLAPFVVRNVLDEFIKSKVVRP